MRLRDVSVLRSDICRKLHASALYAVQTRGRQESGVEGCQQKAGMLSIAGVGIKQSGRDVMYDTKILSRAKIVILGGSAPIKEAGMLSKVGVLLGGFPQNVSDLSQLQLAVLAGVRLVKQLLRVTQRLLLHHL